MKTAERRRVKASELKLDFTYYPREEVDEQHVLDLVGALKAGDALPPVVVDQRTGRVADGFHRVRANQLLNGDKAELAVELRHFTNDKAFFLAGVELNARHGQKLRRADLNRIQRIADEQLHVDPKLLAGALHTTASKLAAVVTPPIGRHRPVPAQAAMVQRIPPQRPAPAQLVDAQLEYYAEMIVSALHDKRVDHRNGRLLQRLSQLELSLSQFLKTAQ